MPLLGISRVTDITRLDQIGLPVYASIRPRGKTLRVHSGSGLTPTAARVGALMEAVEYAVAEVVTARPVDVSLPLSEVVAQFPGGLGLFDFAPRMGALLPVETPTEVVRCEDLVTGNTTLLPAELVLLPCRGRASSYFGSPSNGLAAGNTLEEASLHALLEILERDAIAMNRARNLSARLDSRDLPSPFCEWAAAWRQRGVELIVRYIPNVCGLPCFEAHLHDAASLDVNLTAGTALHFDRTAALSRAICEAVQSRTGTIHGGRDDLTQYFAKYDMADQALRRQAEATLLQYLNDGTRGIAFGETPHECPASAESALAGLLSRLTSLGFPHVFRYRMTEEAGLGDLLGLQVVKLVVPRCEATSNAGPRMGPRLLARLLNHA